MYRQILSTILLEFIPSRGIFGEDPCQRKILTMHHLYNWRAFSWSILLLCPAPAVLSTFPSWGFAATTEITRCLSLSTPCNLDQTHKCPWSCSWEGTLFGCSLSNSGVYLSLAFERQRRHQLAITGSKQVSLCSAGHLKSDLALWVQAISLTAVMPISSLCLAHWRGEDEWPPAQMQAAIHFQKEVHASYSLETVQVEGSKILARGADMVSGMQIYTFEMIWIDCHLCSSHEGETAALKTIQEAHPGPLPHIFDCSISQMPAAWFRLPRLDGLLVSMPLPA